jgi:hypothetical protein
MIDPDTERCFLGLVVAFMAGGATWTGFAILLAYLGWLG